MVLKKLKIKKDEGAKYKDEKKLPQSNSTKKALLLTIIILVGAIIFFWVASSAVKMLRGPLMGLLMSDLIILRFLLSLLIVMLSATLIFIYLKDYFEIKNELTLALIITVSSMMFFGIAINPFFMVFFPMGSFWFVQTISLFFTFLALVGLLWISLK